MNENLQKLLEKVSFLNEDQKSMYAYIFIGLGENDKAKFMEIIQEAADKEASLKNAAAVEKSDAIKEFLSDCDTLFKSELQIAKDMEESDEKAGADKILDNL